MTEPSPVTGWSSQRWVAVATTAMAVVLVAGWVLSPWGPTRSTAWPVEPVVIATGPTGGVAQKYGLALAELAAEQSGQVHTLVTGGSRENLDLLVDGEASFALATADVVEQYLATEPGAESIRAVARLYDSYVQLVVRADSGLAVHRLAHLRGLTVAVGGRGSGNTLTADRILAAAGIDPTTDITRVELGRAEAVVALRSERIDAFFVVEGLPSPDLMRVSAGQGTAVRFLDLGDVVRDLIGSPVCPDATCTVYHAGTLPAGTYPNLAVSISTVTVPTLLLTTTAVSDATVRHLAGVVFDHAAQVAASVPAVSQISRHAAIFTGRVPLHDGARAYYRAAKVAA